MADYNSSLPVAGKLETLKLTAAADDYYVGMPLAWDAANLNYAYNATAPEVIVYEEKSLAATGSLLCAVAGSDFPEGSIVDDSNAALTVTDAIRASLLKNGIRPRR
jgi:hypothetical protein